MLFCNLSPFSFQSNQLLSRFIVDLPVIDAQRSSKTVYSYVGNPNPVTLECFADGRPAPTYFWKNNFGLNVSYQSTYTLVNPKEADLGFTYQCFATNAVGLSKAHLVKVEKLGRFCCLFGVIHGLFFSMCYY